MLTAQLINPSYSYVKDGVINFSCSLEVSEGGTVVAGTGLSCVTSFLRQAADGSTEANPNWDTAITASIKEQAEAYINQYKFLMQLVNVKYPTAVIPQDAVETIMAAIVLEV